MEGTQGIKLEMTKVTLTQAPQVAEPKVMPQVEKPKIAERHPDEIEMLYKNDVRTKKEQSKFHTTTGEVDPIQEKTQEVFDLLEKLGGNLSEEAKLAILQYLPEEAKAVDLDDDSDEQVKLVDTLAELTRFLAVLFALLALLIFQNKDTYSGRDLQLGDEPPEGNQNEAVNTLLGNNNKQSWGSFKKEVEMIPEMPSGQFMATVLEINLRYSGRMMKLKKGEGQEKRKTLQKPNRRKLALAARMRKVA